MDTIYEVEYYYRLEKVKDLKMLDVDVLHTRRQEPQRRRYEDYGSSETVVGSLIVKKPNGEFDLILALERKRWQRLR